MSEKSVYATFDEVMKIASEEPSPRGHKAIVERLAELAQYLPQFPAIQNINPGQHISWARRALTTEITISLLDRRQKVGGDVLDAAEQEDYEKAWKQCLWHLRRASGIGGSEIGTIVLNMSRGQNGDFGSAHNTVKEKLLLLAPQIGEPAMRRGHQMEDYVRQIHHRSSGEVEDENSLQALRGFRSPDHPYIIGTPDDITLRVRDGKRERVLLDYKCPGKDVLDGYKRDGVPFGYSAQLHHYLIVSKDAGIKINALQLVPFDYHGGANTLIMPVSHDPNLEHEIKSTAQTLWDEFVMRGRIPEPMTAQPLRVEAPEVGDAMRRAGVMKAIATEVAKRAEEMRQEAVLLADTNVDKKAIGRIDSGFYFISRDAEWDEETLLDLASKAGLDPEQFRVNSESKVNAKLAAKMFSEAKGLIMSGKRGAGREVLLLIGKGIDDVMVTEINLDALAEALDKAGVDVSYAYTIKERAGLTTKRKGPDAEQRAIVEEKAAGLINEITALMDARIEDFISDDDPDEDEPEGVSF